MTLRTMAKILGISPAYLSLLVNDKRKWRGDLRERYELLVNTFVNTEEKDHKIGANKTDGPVPSKGQWWSCGDSNPVPLQCH